MFHVKHKNRIPERSGIPPQTKSSKEGSHSSLFHVERSAALVARRIVDLFHAERNHRHRTFVQWALASLAENGGHDVFPVERTDAFQLHQAAPICFTWNVTEPLATDRQPCLVPRGTLAVLHHLQTGSVTRSFHEERLSLLLWLSLPASDQ